jgi:hypothetical protein
MPQPINFRWNAYDGVFVKTAVYGFPQLTCLEATFGEATLSPPCLDIAHSLPKKNTLAVGIKRYANWLPAKASVP